MIDHVDAWRGICSFSAENTSVWLAAGVITFHVSTYVQ
jgi:hypothetical protein